MRVLRDGSRIKCYICTSRHTLRAAHKNSLLGVIKCNNIAYIAAIDGRRVAYGPGSKDGVWRR